MVPIPLAKYWYQEKKILIFVNNFNAWGKMLSPSILQHVVKKWIQPSTTNEIQNHEIEVYLKKFPSLKIKREELHKLQKMKSKNIKRNNQIEQETHKGQNFLKGKINAL